MTVLAFDNWKPKEPQSKNQGFIIVWSNIFIVNRCTLTGVTNSEIPLFYDT